MFINHITWSMYYFKSPIATMLYLHELLPYKDVGSIIGVFTSLDRREQLELCWTWVGRLMDHIWLLRQSAHMVAVSLLLLQDFPSGLKNVSIFVHVSNKITKYTPQSNISNKDWGMCFQYYKYLVFGPSGNSIGNLYVHTSAIVLGWLS